MLVLCTLLTDEFNNMCIFFQGQNVNYFSTNSTWHNQCTARNELVYCTTNLSISENFNGMPVSITQRQCRQWIRNHQFSITKIESKAWIAINKFYGHEIFQRRWVGDRSSVEEHLTASGRRRHELKTHLVSLIRLQRLQYHIPTVPSERYLRLLAARAFETNWTRTAEKTDISITHARESF